MRIALKIDPETHQLLRRTSYRLPNSDSDMIADHF